MAETHQRGANRFCIDVAHYLSDVLFLPPKRIAGLDLTCLQDGVEQVLVQPDLPQVRLLQRNQLFAEFLQREKLAFSRAFAGL